MLRKPEIRAGNNENSARPITIGADLTLLDDKDIFEIQKYWELTQQTYGSVECDENFNNYMSDQLKN